MCFQFLAPIGAAIGSAASAVGSAIASIPAWVGTVASIGGTVLSVGSSLYGARTAAAAYNYNAAMQQQEAANAMAAAQFEADRTRERARLALAASGARVGTSGVLLEGSPLEALSYAATQYELDALAALYGGQRLSQSRMAASQISSRMANSAMVSGVLGAGASLLTGASRWGPDVIGWFTPRQQIRPEPVTGRFPGPV